MTIIIEYNRSRGDGEMSIAVICSVTWLVISVFAIVPKRFTLVDMVFIYFVSTILSRTIFTILDINLQWVPASRETEKALALNIGRFIEIPLILIMAADILNSRLRTPNRWGIALVICLFLTINDWIYLSLDIVEYRKWNYIYAFIDYGLFIVIIAWIARWFVLLHRGGMEKV